MISIWEAFREGLRSAWKYKKVILLLYSFNLLFAYLLVIPFSNMFAKGLDFTTAASSVLNKFDITVFTTIWGEYGGAAGPFRLIVTYGLVYILLNTFFAGGILHLLKEDLEFSLKDFLTGCTLYFKRFFKLVLISIIYLLFALITYPILSIVFGIFVSDANTEFWPVILFIVKICVLIFMAAMINMIFDYARIITVYNDFYRMFKTVKDTLMFVMMSPIKTTGLYSLYFLSGAILLIIYMFLDSMLEVNSAVSILFFVIISQMYIVLKLFIKLGFYTGQFTFYTHANTAMPGMSKEMLDDMVRAYELRIQKNEGIS